MVTSTVARVPVAAPADVLWEVLVQHEQMTDWFPARKVRLERAGKPERNGVGAIRAIHTLGPAAREEIIAYEPTRLIAYRLLSGLPFRDYQGQAEAAPHPDGCTLTWTISFTEIIPGSRVIVAAMARRLAKGAAREAERLHSQTAC